MNREEQKKMGLTHIETLVEEVEKCREKGWISQARTAFEQATGAVMVLAITEIITDAEEKELREELYNKHYVFEE
jgi:hypothetical protein